MCACIAARSVLMLAGTTKGLSWNVMKNRSFHLFGFVRQNSTWIEIEDRLTLLRPRVSKFADLAVTDFFE